jgi:hypothetical protein
MSVSLDFWQRPQKQPRADLVAAKAATPFKRPENMAILPGSGIRMNPARSAGRISIFVLGDAFHW